MTKDECVELKNIEYQSMLLKNNKVKKTKPNTIDIYDYLMEEKNKNKKKSWNKLTLTTKLTKLKTYINEYSKKKSLTPKKKNN